MRIGVLHPGEMGSSIGAALRAAGVEACWVSAGRSPATRARAQADALIDVGELATLAKVAEGIISVCPPAAALDVAAAVAGAGFEGIYLDANAIAPATARKVEAKVERAGARFVDGGVVGPPARRPGSTRLYLSGSVAPEVAGWFSSGPLEAIVVDDRAGSASAMKLSYAAWTKGSSALLLAVRALARAEGVEEVLLAEWARSRPELVEESAASARRSAPKAWRLVGEMHEIADTFDEADLPDGFHRAAAEIFRRLAHFKDSPEADPGEVLDALVAAS